MSDHPVSGEPKWDDLHSSTKAWIRRLNESRWRMIRAVSPGANGVVDEWESTTIKRVESLREVLHLFIDDHPWACTDFENYTLCDHCDYRHRGFDGMHEVDCPIRRATEVLGGGR